MYGKPTFTGLHNFQKTLKDTATNVPTETTNINYGLLTLIISPTDWEKLYGHKRIPPNAPGAPPILAVGTLTVNTNNIIHSHQN